MEKYGIRVVIADDHPSILLGVRHVLSASIGIHVVGEASNPSELIQTVQSTSCDVVVTDYAMPGGRFVDGIALFQHLRNRYPGIRIVVLTMIESMAVLQKLSQLGVLCIVNKADRLEHMVTAVHVAYVGGEYYSPAMHRLLSEASSEGCGLDGGAALSPREFEVLRFILGGHSITEIANLFHRSKKTISTQKAAVMRKLGVTTDVDLFRYGLEMGLVPLSRTEGVDARRPACPAGNAPLGCDTP
jgi:two-component system capsular synthesis response regulator RcsB